MTEKDQTRVKEADVWSVENMAAHGAEGRSVTYIGSAAHGRWVFDYYEDDRGCFWYKTRVYNKYDELVSLEEAVFNREGRKKARFRSGKRT